MPIRRPILAGALFFAVTLPVFAQDAPKPPSKADLEKIAAGDSPDNPGPLATDLSPATDKASVHKAMRKVADWQIRTGEPRFNQLWTFAALYSGLLEASRSTGDPKYKDAVLRMAEHFHWQLVDNRFPHADDEAIGRAYLELYIDNPAPERIAMTKEILDRLVVRPDDPAKKLWWWCDALFMAPPVLTEMAKVTHDRRYLDYMDKEWWETSAYLYDPAERLYFRDDTYFKRAEANGKKLFWARGNGWVLAGLATVLENMPADYPTRAKYEQQFREMAERVAGLQQPDGLWRSGLLDPAAYEQPEISGSAFFTYGIAWGINHHLLNRKQYLPVVTKGWAGMTKHIYADGRLGDIQPVGAAPAAVKPSSSYVYGVGAFLLAGSEIVKLGKK
ncbi:Rhamnogalacturonyl hydrolase YesR [Granulicella rosea]|uniref:Rhamnogalacturonyl hydrolase YesR n=1 Tax=Granulicella rosea TaxID=474952 RepID=A0A239LXP5_9BACT|nr:glycoside hydrolase family 88 protein [Granulicella rosea]SNT35231.1 Rhamnogalacturonyl hydrolase YesR [Granulicella rosea]